MVSRKRVAVSALALALAAGTAGGAVAQSGGSNTNAGSDTQASELQAIQNAKLTIADAARAAETETGGKAVNVSIGDENGQIAYQVEVALNDGTMKDVHVDTRTGKILKVSNDTEDQDENEDGEQGENGEQGESGEN